MRRTDRTITEIRTESGSVLTFTNYKDNISIVYKVWDDAGTFLLTKEDVKEVIKVLQELINE